MANVSFVQDRFLGGAWSPHAQGRVNDPNYKQAMNVCHNGYPTEEGAWIRRQGFRYLAHTRGGAAAVLRAFDFSTSQPYQLEFTEGFVRFFAGLGHVTTDDGTILVESVTDESHARLILATEIPSGWVNGNTVEFDINTSPCSAPLLCGRQFVLADKSTVTNSFTLKDALTGAYIDGATIGYVVPTGTVADTVAKIFELVTPYTADDLQALRCVQDDTTVLTLHGSYAPRVIYQQDPFAIATANFIDGPYLDINNTTTTLTPSAVTGSITLTASSTTGINSGFGFASTDVDRLVRLQIGPKAWNSGTTYDKAATVTGSDGNIYTSIAGANTNHNPTTDDGTHWEISPTTVTWAWLKITHFTDTTHVTATVMGDDLPATTATATWRLGLYSDTTGWPKCGAYHEGRIWLSGVVGNRLDAGTSNNRDPLTGEAMPVGSYCFAPTAADGTVADDNGISATFNSKEVNAIFWMLSTDDGLMCGAQSGEWRIKASALDDPISPSTIQARKVSTYGAANVEPVNTSRVVYVQRAKRKMLAMEQVAANKYLSDNVTHLADNLVSDGIEEIVWQQEPSLTIWARTSTGGLVGCVYQKGMGEKDDNFQAFFSTALGSERAVESISAGPAYNGTSDALYAVTNQTDSDEPDYNVRWVEYLMPRFDAASEDWSAYFVDGGANPCCAEVKSIANGDSFDGIRIYGLWNLNGKSITPVMGGLDLGDRTVSGGYVDIAYLSDPAGVFTLAFLSGLSDGTDFGVFALTATFETAVSPVTPPVASNTLLALVGADTSHVSGSYNGYAHLDPNNDRVFEINQRSGAITPGIRRLNGTTGAEQQQADLRQIMGTPVSGGLWDSMVTYAEGAVVTGTDMEIYTSLAGSNLNNDPVTDGEVHWTAHAGVYGMAATVSLYHPDGFIYSFAEGSNRSRLTKINASTLVLAGVFGITSGSLAGSDATGLQLGFNTMAPIQRINISDGGSITNYLLTCGIIAAGDVKEVAITNVDLMTFLSADIPGQDLMVCCRGYTREGFGTAFVLGKDSYVLDNADPIVFYEFVVDGDMVTLPDGTIDHLEQSFYRKIISFVPSDIDATWTDFHKVGCPAYDKLDHALIFFVQSPAGPTNTSYIVKISASTGETIWKTAFNLDLLYAPRDQEMSVMDIKAHKFAWYRPASGHDISILDTKTGTLTTQTVNAGLVNTGACYYDDDSASITLYCTFTATGVPAVTYGNAIHTLSSQWGRYYVGLNQEQPSHLTSYSVPSSIGFTYTSQGQLLRPDYGQDAGTQAGPAFGKKRRLHSYAAAFYRTRSISFGTDFSNLRPVPLTTAGGTPIVAPTLYSDTFWTSVDNDYSFNGQIAWEITRPYPATVLTLSGYLAGTDK